MKDILSSRLNLPFAWRVALGVPLFAALIFTFYARQQGWFGWNSFEPDVVVPCPELQKGCMIQLNGQSFRVSTDVVPLEGQPFDLRVQGPAEAMHARFVQKDNKSRTDLLALEQAKKTPQLWTIQAQLPQSEPKNREWLLRVTIDGQYKAELVTLIQ